MQLRSLCVYCGSSAGHRPVYADAARAFARALVARGIGLVYGGSSYGIMGALADEVLHAGGSATGVIPRSLVSRERAHRGLTELHVTDSMHERKAVMAELADGFVALPGGVGTMEELLEIWTWAQLGIHHKPCGLLNAAGYYDGLVSFLDAASGEGFIQPAQREMLLVAATPEALLDRLERYEPPPVEPSLPKSAT